MSDVEVPSILVVPNDVGDTVLGVQGGAVRRFEVDSGSGLVSEASVNSLPNVKHFHQKIRSAQSDVYMIVLGDSTGNSTDEWVYKLAGMIAADYPTHSVRYRLFVDATGWDSEVVISTGSGARSIYVDNVSHPGSTERYYQGANKARIYNASREYDLVIISHGHNEGTSVAESVLQMGFSEGVFAARQDNPSAAICVTLQNPRRDFPDHSARAVSSWCKIAAANALGVIDVYSAFTALGNPPELYLDDIHPNSAGMDLWASVAHKALGSSPISEHGQYIKAYAGEQRLNFAPNPAFNDWDSTKPFNWSLTNSTSERDLSLRDSFAFSVKLTATSASSPQMFCDLSDHLHAFRGQWITFAARCYKGVGATTNSGRLQLSGTGLTTVTSRSKLLEAEGGWMWAIVHAYISQSVTTLQAKILVGDAIGHVLNVDRVFVGTGIVPSDIDWVSQPFPELSEYYSPINVGIPSGFDGTLSVVNNSFTLTGNTTQARVYINVYYLVPGQQYRISWVRNNSSTGDVRARDAVNGAGNIIASAELETVTSLTWTAVNKSESVLFSTDGVTPIDVSSLSIIKL